MPSTTAGDRLLDRVHEYGAQRIGGHAGEAGGLMTGAPLLGRGAALGMAMARTGREEQAA